MGRVYLAIPALSRAVGRPSLTVAPCSAWRPSLTSAFGTPDRLSASTYTPLFLAYTSYLSIPLLSPEQHLVSHQVLTSHSPWFVPGPFQKPHLPSRAWRGGVQVCKRRVNNQVDRQRLGVDRPKDAEKARKVAAKPGLGRQ